MLRVESVGTRQVADPSRSIWMKNGYENIEVVKRSVIILWKEAKKCTIILTDESAAEEEKEKILS